MEPNVGYYYPPPAMAGPDASHYARSVQGVDQYDPRGMYGGSGPERQMRAASPVHGRYMTEHPDYYPVHPVADVPPPLLPPPGAREDGLPMPVAVDMGHGPVPMGAHMEAHDMPEAAVMVRPAGGTSRRAPSSSHRSVRRGPPGGGEAPASKRDRKRREILERLERAHWEGLDNRDALYHDAYVNLTTTYQTLMMRPSLVREYALSLANYTVKRSEILRSNALYHAFLNDRGQHLYEAEHAKIEDEARIAKRTTRDRLLGVIEERKRRLKEERDGGEFAADFLLEPNQRLSTRQLRNKGSQTNAPTTRLGRFLDDEDASAGRRRHGVAAAVAQLLGWTELEVAMTIAAASAGSDEDTLACRDAEGHTVHVPLQATLAAPSSLLAGVHLAPVAAGKSKKKNAGTKLAPGTAERGEDEDATSAPLLSSGGGRLRWDTAKCLSQLTSAKDIEVEADLIHIRKVNSKRRRR